MSSATGPVAQGSDVRSVYTAFEDATGLFHAEVMVERGDGPYPARVYLELENTSPPALLAYDARRLGELLVLAADQADHLDELRMGLEALEAGPQAPADRRSSIPESGGPGV